MKKNDPKKAKYTLGLDIKIDETLKIRKPALQTPPIPKSSTNNLFNAKSMDEQLTAFDILQPKTPPGESSPQYLAVTNKIRKNVFVPNILKQTLPPQPASIFSKRKAISVHPSATRLLAEKEERKERNEIDFQEDPKAYFKKHESNGSGQKFIYMMLAKDRNDPEFSPYELKKVIHKEVGENYYTMSANGVTYIDSKGNTDYTSLDQWTKESNDFSTIRKLNFFKFYSYWKPIKLWKLYILHSRYQSIYKESMQIPILSDICLPKVTVHVNKLMCDCEKEISRILLPFFLQRKLKMKEFVNLCKDNMQKIKDIYQTFIESVGFYIQEVYKIKSDPKNLEVHDDDFAENHRVNTNIQQLQILENKKLADKEMKIQKMDTDIRELIKYTRMIDYNLLESQRKMVYDVFGKSASLINADASEAFQIDVTYNSKGEVTFSPSIDDLIQTTKEMFSLALQTIEELPRIYTMPTLKQLLTYTTETPEELFFNGPTLLEMMNCSPFLNDTMNSIFAQMRKSFDTATIISQVFTEYYPLYKVGETWNIREYIHKMDGSLYQGELSLYDRPFEVTEIDFLTNPQNEPMIDLEKIIKDVQFLKAENEKSASIRGGATCGIFYVDSLLLRSKLAPIPKNSLNDLNKLLHDFVDLKVELLSRLFKNYKAKLKNDSTTLACFTDICILLNTIESLLPKINKELSLIDDVQATIESSGFTITEYNIHDQYKQFKKEYDDAVVVKMYNTNKYQNTLRIMVSDIEKKLNEGFVISRKAPESVKAMNLKEFRENIAAAKNIITDIKPSIENCQSYQNILGVEVSPFTTFKDICNNVEFSENLLKLLTVWEEVNSLIILSQFKFISIDNFEKCFKEATEYIDNIHHKYQRIPGILIEIEEVKTKYQQYMPQIRKLLVSRLKDQHWDQLFLETGKKGMYKPTLTLKELVHMGIMSNTSSIDKISEDAIGQDAVTSEFSEIRNKWDDTKIPLVSYKPKDELDITLLPIDQFLVEIEDASIQLERLLTNKFANIIDCEIKAVRFRLNNAINVLSEWWRFQTNWQIIYTLFKNKSLNEILKQQTSNYNYIQMKFKVISRYVLDNPNVLPATSFQNMSSDFASINEKADEIMASLSELAEMKRREIPRFCLLSDYEIITMITTKDFNIFMPNVLKLFMYISKFDYKTLQLQGKEIDYSIYGSNFPTLVIFSAIGEDNDTLRFNGQIQCLGAIELWLSNLHEIMSQSLTTSLKASITSFEDSAINDWSMGNTSYVCLLTLLCWFTKKIDACFSNFANNPRAFLPLDKEIRTQMSDLINSFNSLTGIEYKKAAMIITLLQRFLNKMEIMLEKNSSYSPYLVWKHQLKYYFNDKRYKLTFCSDNESYEHNGEFWGDATGFMFTESMEKTLTNFLFTKSIDRIPLVFSEPGSGATTFIKMLSMLFGNFLYNSPSFYNENHMLIARLLKGAISSGFWIHFMNSERLSYKNNCFITDSIRDLMEKRSAGAKTVVIDKEEITISPNAYVFLSTSHEALKNNSLPPQLVSYTRQIAFNKPPLREVVYIRLLSLGFKSANQSASKLVALFDSLSKEINFPDSVHHIALFVVNNAHHTIDEILHSAHTPFLSPNEDYKTTEEYSLALSVFQYFNKDIFESKIVLLVQEIHSTFLCSWTFDVLLNRLNNSSCFSDGYSREIIEKLGAEYLKEVGEEAQVDYLTGKLVQLVELMQKKSCVILSGPPNSGKTLLIKMLDALFKKLAKVEKLPKLPCVEQLFIETIYHNSMNWNEIFGTIKDNKWVFGLIEPTLYYLQYSKSIPTHKVLVFDGTMTPEFVNFLDQAVSNNFTLCLTTGSSYSVGVDFHIFVETDNIASVDPKLITRCAVLSLNNIQSPYLSINNNPVCSLPMPEIPFKRCSLEFPGMFNENELSSLKKLFCGIAPKIIKFISSQNTLIPMKEYSDPIAHAIIVYTFVYLKKFDINPANVEDAKNVIFICAYTICDSFLSQSDADRLAIYIESEFKPKLPKDWKGLNVLDEFWDFYPTPTIADVRLYRGNFIPMQHDWISKPAIREVEKNQKLFNPESMMLPLVQNVRQYNLIKMCLEQNLNVLIHGPPGSGKSTLIKQIIREKHKLNPVFITVTRCTTSRSIIDLIMQQSEIISPTRKLEKETKCLIFENVEYYNRDIIDLIRLLLDKRELRNYSPIDQKVYKKLYVNNFIVVVATSDISKLPARFVSRFVTTKLMMQTKITKQQYIKRMLLEASVAPNLALFTAKIVSELKCTFHQINTIIFPLCNIIDRTGKTQQAKISFVKVLMSEIFLNYFFCNEEKYDTFFSSCENICTEFSLDQAFQMIQVNPTIQLASYNNEKVEVRDYEEATIRAKLTDYATIPLTAQTLFNFTMFDHSLRRPKHHCLVTGQSAISQIQLIKILAQISDYILIDIARNEKKAYVLLKQSIEDCLFNDKVHLVFARVTEKDELMFRFLTSVFIQGTIDVVFSKREMIVLIEKFIGKQCQTKEDFVNAFNEIKLKVQEKIHLAIVAEDLYDFMKLSNYYDFITITQPSPKMFCDQYLTGSLSLVSKVIPRVMESVSDILPFHHPNQFQDLMLLYTKRMHQKEIENDKLMNLLQDSKALVGEIEYIIKETNEKMEKIDAEKEKLKEKNSNLITNISEKNEIIEKKKSIIGEEMLARNVYVREKTDLIKETEEEKLKHIPKLDLSDEQIPEIREMCISLDPVIIAVKETVFAILGTREIGEDFVQKANSIDPDSLEMGMFNQLCQLMLENPFFEKELSGPMSKLGDFVVKAFKYAENNQKHEELRLDLTQRQKSMEMFNIMAKKEYQNIKREEIDKSAFSKKLENIDSELSHLESIRKDLEFKLSVLNNFMRDISFIEEKWTDRLEECEKRLSSMIADELLYSAYIVYCGMMQRKERVEFLGLISDALNAKHFETMYAQPIEQIEEQLMNPEGIKPIQYIPASLRIEIGHIFNAPKTPLIIDPDGITLKTIKESFECLTVSMYSTEFNNVLKEAMKRGVVFIALDVDELTSHILNMLTQDIVTDYAIIVDSELVQIKEGFVSLFFTNHTVIHSVPHSLLSRTTLIDCSEASVDALHNRITKNIIVHYDQDLFIKMIHADETEQKINHQLEEYEQAIIENCSNVEQKIANIPSYDIMNDYDTINDIIKSKDLYLSTISNMPNFGSIHKLFSQTVAQFSSITEIIKSFWYVLTRKMPQVDPRYKFSLDEFMQQIEIMLTSSQATLDEIPNFKQLVIQSITQWVYPSLSFSDIMFFLFASAFSQKRIPWKDFDMIIDHIKQESRGSIGYIEPDVAPSRVPENLKFASCETFYQLIMSFIQDMFGPNFMNSIPKFQVEHLFTGPEFMPTLVFPTHGSDPSDLISDYVSMRSLTEDVVSISLVDDDFELKMLKKVFAEISKLAKTLILHYSKPSTKITSLLFDFVTESKSEKSVHRSFKLVIICNTTEFIPSSILESTRKITVDNFASPRRIVSTVYEQAGMMISSQLEENRDLGKILVLISFLYAQIRLRSFIHPLCFTEQINNISELDIRSLIEILNSYTTNKNDSSLQQSLPMKNIRDIAGDILFLDKTINPIDSQRIKALLSLMLSQESIKDGFMFTEKQSDSGDSFNWALPPNGTISQMYQTVNQRLCVIPTIDGAVVNSATAKVILKLNLSRWVMEPFISIYKTTNSNVFHSETREMFYLGQIPEEIVVKGTAANSLERDFWLSEAKKFNQQVKNMRDTVNDDDVIRDLNECLAPKKWRSKNNCEPESIVQFIGFLKSRKEFLNKALNVPNADLTEIQASQIYDLRGLLLCFLTASSYAKHHPLETMELHFIATDAMIPNSIALNNLYIMGSNITDGNVLVPKISKAFTKLNRLVVKVDKISPITTRSFSCPLYTSIDGEFVYNMKLSSDRPDRTLLLEGITFFCALPSQLKP